MRPTFFPFKIPSKHIRPSREKSPFRSLSPLFQFCLRVEAKTTKKLSLFLFSREGLEGLRARTSVARYYIHIIIPSDDHPGSIKAAIRAFYSSTPPPALRNWRGAPLFFSRSRAKERERGREGGREKNEIARSLATGKRRVS